MVWRPINPSAESIVSANYEGKTIDYLHQYRNTALRGHPHDRSPDPADGARGTAECLLDAQHAAGGPPASPTPRWAPAGAARQDEGTTGPLCRQVNRIYLKICYKKTGEFGKLQAAGRVYTPVAHFGSRKTVFVRHSHRHGIRAGLRPLEPSPPLRCPWLRPRPLWPSCACSCSALLFVLSVLQTLPYCHVSSRSRRVVCHWPRCRGQ